MAENTPAVEATPEQVLALVKAALNLYVEMQFVQLPEGEEIRTFPAFASALHALPDTQRLIADQKARLEICLNGERSAAE